MPSLTPFRIRERIRSLFLQTLDNIQSLAEMKPDEIPEAEVSPPPIPTDLSSRQFPQKELVAGVKAILPEILEESKKQGELVQIFLAITLLETVEETEARFWFLTEQEQGLKPIILLWAQAYQNQTYMLPPLMATVHWGFTTIIW